MQTKIISTNTLQGNNGVNFIALSSSLQDYQQDATFIYCFKLVVRNIETLSIFQGTYLGNKLGYFSLALTFRHLQAYLGKSKLKLFKSCG